jgi:hypothetical protein
MRIEGDMYHWLLRTASVWNEVHEILQSLSDVHLARTVIKGAVLAEASVPKVTNCLQCLTEELCLDETPKWLTPPGRQWMRMNGLL